MMTAAIALIRATLITSKIVPTALPQASHSDQSAQSLCAIQSNVPTAGDPVKAEKMRDMRRRSGVALCAGVEGLRRRVRIRQEMTAFQPIKPAASVTR